MIRIKSKNPPIIWQVDTTHNLPKISGAVRWNGGTSEFEVCDIRGTWHRIDPSVQMDGIPEIQEVLLWAKRKMLEEKMIEDLSDEYPAIKDTKEQLDTLIALLKNKTKS